MWGKPKKRRSHAVHSDMRNADVCEDVVEDCVV